MVGSRMDLASESFSKRIRFNWTEAAVDSCKRGAISFADCETRFQCCWPN